MDELYEDTIAADATTERERREQALQELMQHLRSQPVIGIGPVSRDEMHDR